MWHRFWVWLGNLSNSISIAAALGVPVTFGGLVGWWAGAAQSGYVIGVLVALFVFGAVLWGMIGILWMLHHFQQRDPYKSRKLLDCSWGLRVDGLLLNFDPGSPKHEWQVILLVRNSLSWPIRVFAEQTDVVIEGRVPDGHIETNIPVVIMHNGAAAFNFPPYNKESIPDKERIKGRVDVRLRYGHPDGGYSRVAIRKLAFEAVLKPPGTENAFLIPVSNQIPLQSFPREEDMDIPYVEVRRN